MGRMNQEQRRKNIERKNTALLFQQQNFQIDSYNKSRVAEPEHTANHISFEDSLHNVDAIRLNKLKQELKNQTN